MLVWQLRVPPQLVMSLATWPEDYPGQVARPLGDQQFARHDYFPWVWGPKPTQAFCTLPLSGTVDRIHVALKAGEWRVWQWEEWKCGSEKKGRDVTIDGPVTMPSVDHQPNYFAKSISLWPTDWLSSIATSRESGVENLPRLSAPWKNFKK